MKIKRLKKFQRNLKFFRKYFEFEAPYHILIDGTFANAVLLEKVNMREQFPKTFDGACTLFTSPCAMIETEKLGPSLYGAVQVLKGLKLCKCDHLENPVPASQCIKSLARKPKVQKEEESNGNGRFVVATQDSNLRSCLRETLGVPLLYLHGSAPTLEKPSDRNTKWAEKRDKKKLSTTGYQKEILQQIKREILPDSDGLVRKGTKKRKRAPNPLSCKKTKKPKLAPGPVVQQSSSSSAPSAEEAPKRKRKRVKVRVPKHVKEVLSST